MDELKPLLVTLLEGLKTSSDFAIEQAPLVLREMLWWGVGTAIFWWVFWWMVSALIYFKLTRAVEKTWSNGAEFTPWIRGGAYLLALAGAAANAYTLVQIWLAPRLYLIETIGRILRGK